MREPDVDSSRLSRTFGTLLLVCVCSGPLLLPGSGRAVTLGVLGDSLSDEYAEEAYGLYAQNWNEQLVTFAGFDTGPTASGAGEPGGTWGEPRRTGNEYNWARSGATSGTLLSAGQHTGLAAQVGPQSIDYAAMMIGANDFNPSGAAYQNIYAGNWSQATIDAHIAQLIANIETALDTLLPTGVGLVLVNVPDYGLTPTVQSLFTNTAGRQAVADAIAQANAEIDAVAQARGLVLVDFATAAIAIFGPHGSPNATLAIGNVDISLTGSDTAAGGNPTAAFVHDGVHPNTTLQGIIANFAITALNIGHGAGLVPFTEEEILAHRGIAYGGSDTLAAQIGSYSDYVTVYAGVSVPALGAPGLAILALALLLVGCGRYAGNLLPREAHVRDSERRPAARSLR